MTLLSVEGLAKSFGMKPLLAGVSFSLADDEKMGLIGANGSGKTTLLRMIAGVEKPDAGRISVSGGGRVAYLPQQPVFTAGGSVLDAVFDLADPTLRLLHDYEEAAHRLAANGHDERLLARVTDLSHRLDVTGAWDREARARAVLDRLGLPDFDAPVDSLSGGQRKRVALARALVLEPALLLLDEPTNHLDTATVAWLETWLSRYRGALLVVTHDRYFLDRVTNRMLEVDPGGVRRYEGNYTRYLELKEEQERLADAVERTRRNLARRELEWLRRGPKARTSKAKYRVERAQALQEGGRAAPEAGLELAAASTRLGKKVLEFDRLAKAWDGVPAVTGFSRILTADDRIGIVGPNGAGKTTLLEMIAGRLEPDSGRMERGDTVVIGYFDQESRPLDESLRVIDTVTKVAENVRTVDGTVITASRMLERFLFPPAVQYTPVANLSGGERRRLHLLLVLMGAPNVLLLDEPTNDLDIPTLAALEEYLDTFPGVVLAVSHDRWFLDRTVDEIWSFEEGGVIRSFPGNYSAWLERVEASAPPAAATVALPRPVPEPVAEQPASPARLSFKERKELAELETRIEAAEARRTAIEAEMAARATDYEAVAALSAELAELGHALERHVERWAELAERA